MANDLPPRIGRYEVLERLGAGGMGEVLRARDPRLDREIAIKVLPPEVAEDRRRIARFEHEARLLAAIDHDNVAVVYGFELLDEAPCLLMELVRGCDLARHLEAAAPLSAAEAVPLFLQIALGLQAAHARGVVHRDLKPGNVMLGADGRVKLLDFGLARSLVDPPSSVGSTISQADTADLVLTQTGQLVGTPAYMSPERARGEPAGVRSDIWAFGCCLFQGLTGISPFAGATREETLAKVLHTEPDWSCLPADLPGPLRQLLEHCLHREPCDRCPDLDQIIGVLAQLAGKPETGRSTTLLASPWLLSSLIAALLACILALILVVTAPPQDQPSGTDAATHPPAPTHVPTAAGPAGRGAPLIIVIPMDKDLEELEPVEIEALQQRVLDALDEAIPVLSRDLETRPERPE